MPTLFWIAIVALLGIAYLVRVYRMGELRKEMDQMAAINKKLEVRNCMLEMELSNMQISMGEQKSTLTKLKEMVDKLSPKPKEEKPVDNQGFKGPKSKTAPVTQTPTRQATSSSHRQDRVDNSIYVADPMSPLNPLSPMYQNQATMRDDTPVHSSHRHDDTTSYSPSVCSDDSSTTRSSGYDSSPSYDPGSSSDSGSSGGSCD